VSYVPCGVCEKLEVGKEDMPSFPTSNCSSGVCNFELLASTSLDIRLLQIFVLSQVLVEPFEGARPCQFSGALVIARRRVVVEAVLFAVVHV